MDQEIEIYKQVKIYLESLGYPSNTILRQYITQDKTHVDIAVKATDNVLVVVELKNNLSVDFSSKEELGYHPVTRQLQKQAEHVGAKYYLLSDGKQHLWMQTGSKGRPELTVEINYRNFKGKTLSDVEFTKFVLGHVFEYIRNYPITNDTLYDYSLILYSKLLTETSPDQNSTLVLDDLISRSLAINNKMNWADAKNIITEALERLNEVQLLSNRMAVLEIAEEYFRIYRHEWFVPGWLSDLMVKLLGQPKNGKIATLFTGNGLLSAASYLNNYTNITSYYFNENDIYWIKIQQLLILKEEEDVQFEPGFLSGEFHVLTSARFDGILLSAPFNLKFNFLSNSYLGSQGIKDGNSLFIESALDAVSPGGSIVAIVPDGFLLSNLYIKARKFIVENSGIESIISLPIDTFRPFAAVKATLLVLKKTSPGPLSKTFFASLEEVPSNISLRAENDVKISIVLKNFTAFKLGENLKPSKEGFVLGQPGYENLHFSKYWFEINPRNITELDKGFIAIPLKQLIENFFKGSQLVTDHSNGNIPYIGPGAVRNMAINQDSFSYTSASKLPRGKMAKVKMNDVVISIIGPYRGKAALITAEFADLLINRHLIAIRPNSDLVHPGYLALALNSEYVQGQFLDNASATVIQALNLSSFEEIYVPVPALEEQQKIFLEYANISNEISIIDIEKGRLEGILNNKIAHLGKEGGAI